MKTCILTAILALASLPAFAGSTAPAIDQTAITTTEASEWSLRFDIYGWAPEPRPGRPFGGTDQGIRAVYGVLKQRYS